MIERQNLAHENEASGKAIKRVEILEARGNPAYPSNIDVVVVLAGPGTFYEKLKNNEQSWQRGMDRQRILKGVQVARNIALSRKYHLNGKNPGLSRQELKTFSPTLLYCGNPQENCHFRQAVDSGEIWLPPEKIMVLDTYSEQENSQVIENTKDQFAALFQLLSDNKPLQGVKLVAIVSHSPHFVRIPHYIKKYEDDFFEKNRRLVHFVAYSVKSNRKTFETFLEDEISKLEKYRRPEFSSLAENPSNFFSVA